MITLNFTLYRFVCNVETFAGFFVPDEAGRCIPETASFACHWLGVPRGRATVVTESSGNTPPFFFKTHGNDMTLNFNNTMGTLFIDGMTEVVAFRIMPTSCVGNPIPIIAKGTLDPLPFLGKPAKNYAIKVRDLNGQIVGKLLFSLEVREVEEDKRNNGFPTPPLDNVDKLNWLSPNEKCLFTNDKTGVADGRRSQERPQENFGVSPLPSNLLATQRECTEKSSDRQGITKGVNHSPLKCDVRQVTGAKYRLLEIDIERIVVKSEGVDADVSAPFLLGGIYYVKIRYCGTISSTIKVECRDPKEIAFSYRATFYEPSDISSEKFRFSLWENNLQVSGFSLDPAKFRVVSGVWKEYAIPFLYYPTKQSVSLEVAVCRKELDNNEQNHFLSEQGVSGGAGDTVSVDTGLAESTTRPPSILSTRGALISQLKIEDEKAFLPSYQSLRNKDFIACLSTKAADADQERESCKRDGNEYVLKPCLNSQKGQTYSNSDLQLNNDRKSDCQMGKHCGAYVTNGYNNVRRSTSCGERTSSYVRDEGPLYVGSSGPSGRRERASGAQIFLEQIANHSSRSLSATRQPMREVELSRAASTHHSDMWKTGGGYRSGTPVRGSASGCYTTFTYEETGDKPVFNGSAHGGYLQPSTCGRSGSQNVFSYEHRDNEFPLDNVTRRMNRESNLIPLLSQTDAHPLRRASLLDEWMEWKARRATAQFSQFGSVRSEYSRDESVDSISSRNRAASPRPTKSFAQCAEQRPYQPAASRRSASRGSATPGIPPRPIR